MCVSLICVCLSIDEEQGEVDREYVWNESSQAGYDIVLWCLHLFAVHKNFPITLPNYAQEHIISNSYQYILF